MSEALPQALSPFLQFSAVLRSNHFAVSPEQTEGFIAARSEERR